MASLFCPQFLLSAPEPSFIPSVLVSLPFVVVIQSNNCNKYHPTSTSKMKNFVFLPRIEFLRQRHICEIGGHNDHFYFSVVESEKRGNLSAPRCAVLLHFTPGSLHLSTGLLSADYRFFVLG